MAHYNNNRYNLLKYNEYVIFFNWVLIMVDSYAKIIYITKFLYKQVKIL